MTRPKNLLKPLPSPVQFEPLETAAALSGLSLKQARARLKKLKNGHDWMVFQRKTYVISTRTEEWWAERLTNELKRICKRCGVTLPLQWGSQLLEATLNGHWKPIPSTRSTRSTAPSTTSAP